MELFPLNNYNNYGNYNTYGGYADKSDNAGRPHPASNGAFGVNAAEKNDQIDFSKRIPGQKRPGKGPGGECETCKNRKYQDGSDEMVSFKTAQHISPESAGARVRAHEQEHVSNAYSKAAQNNGKVIRASVTIHTSICPECGRSYVSGGTTNTQIKYYNEENPYQKDLKASDHDKYAGMNVNYAV